MKKLLSILILSGICSEAIAVSIPWETISGSRSSSGFRWTYSYDIGFLNNMLMIDLDINLIGDTANNNVLLNRWETGIEGIWSTNRFEIPISFNVDWVSENYDQTVYVHDGDTAIFNMLNWNTVGANGWGDEFQEEVVAHEVGHMFGLWDEYTGGAIDPVTGLVNTNGLMHTLDGGTLDYYYDDMLNWYQAAAPVPVPAAAWLFISGLIGLFGIRSYSLTKAPTRTPNFPRNSYR